MASDVELKISADSSELTAAMRSAAESVKSSVEGMRGSFESVGGAIEGMRGKFLALTAVLAGGAMFKEVVDETVKWTGDAVLLSKTLGITTEKASSLNIALDDLNATSLGMHVSTETVTGAIGKLTLRMAKHEQAFAHAGIAIRDHGLHLRNSLDIMLDVNTYLSGLKEGTDRNTEATRLYGRSWIEVQGILGLTKEKMQEAHQRAEELHLLVGPEGVAKTIAYKSALNDVHDQMQAWSVQIGSALMPALTSLGNFLAETGPAASTVLTAAMDALGEAFSMVGDVVGQLWTVIKNVFGLIVEEINSAFGRGGEGVTATEFFVNLMRIVQAVAISLGIGFKEVFSSIGTALQWLGQAFTMFGEIAIAAMHFDWSGIKAATARGTKAMADTLRAGTAEMIDIAVKGREKIDDALLGTAAKPAPKQSKPDSGGANAPDHEDQHKSRVSAWESELEEFKLKKSEEAQAEGRFYEMSKAEEQKFWRDKIALTARGTEENIALRKKVATAGQDILKQEFDAEVESLKSREREYQHNLQAKLDLAQREADLIKQKYGEQSKEFQTAQGHIIEIKRAATEELRKLDQIASDSHSKMLLDQIAAEEESSKLRLDMHEIDDTQMLKLEADFEQRKYEINRKALEDKLALAKNDPDKNAELMAQLQVQQENLTRQHQLRMQAIDNKAKLDAIKNWKSMTDSMQSGFQNVIAGVLKSTMTIAQGIRGLMQTVVGAVIDMLAQVAAKFLANAILEMLIGKTSAKSQITSNAAIAATAAMGSVAAIPFYGWAMAEPVGEATFAAASAYEGMLSAAGGYDIPAGVNPLVQAHQREMILPANLADRVRGMTGSNQDSGPNIVLNYSPQVHAIDTRSGAKFLEQHGGHIVKVLQQQHRNFVPVKK